MTPDPSENYLRDADALLNGETPDTDDDEMRALLELTGEIIDADFSAETRLDALRPAALTMKPKGKYTMSRRARTLLTLAAVFTLIAAAVLTVPPLRALAQEILRRVGLITVTDAPTPYELSLIPMPAVDLVLREDATGTTPPPEFIDARSGWFVGLDGIPEGFDTVEYRNFSFPERRFIFTETIYTSSSDPSKRVSLNQLQLGVNRAGIDVESGGTQPEAVTVNGTPAVWIDEFGDYPGLDVQFLIWNMQRRYDNLEVWLQGSSIGKDEMLAIAGAVTFGEPVENTCCSSSIGVQMTPQEVAAAAGFDFAVPQFMPPVYGSASSWVSTEDGYAQISTWWNTSDLSLVQIKADGGSLVENDLWDIAIGDSPIEDVTVGGNPGVWIGSVPLYDGRFRQNLLIWTQNGSTFKLSAGNTRSREEMFRMAESLVFISADTPENHDRRLLTPDELAGELRMPIAVLKAAPDGYELVSRDGRRVDHSILVTTAYAASDGSDTLVLNQGRYDTAVTASDFAAGDAWVEEVTVNRRTGYWVAMAQTYPDERVGLLVWEQGGYIYRLQSAVLDKDQLMAVAASLKYEGAFF